MDSGRRGVDAGAQEETPAERLQIIDETIKNRVGEGLAFSITRNRERRSGAWALRIAANVGVADQEGTVAARSRMRSRSPSQSPNRTPDTVRTCCRKLRMIGSKPKPDIGVD